MPTPNATGTPLFMYSNVIDGPGGFTEDYTYNMYADGKFVKVPVIFGYVSPLFIFLNSANNMQFCYK